MFIRSSYQALVDGMASQLKSQGASIPEVASSLERWNPVLLHRRVRPIASAQGGAVVLEPVETDTSLAAAVNASHEAGRW